MPKGETSRPTNKGLKSAGVSGDDTLRKVGKQIGSLNTQLFTTVNDAKGLRQVGKYSGKAYPIKQPK